MHVSSTDGCPTFVLYHRFPGVWCSPSSSTQPLPLTARVKGSDLKGKNTASRSYTDDATCEGSALADFLSLFAKPYMEFQSLSFLTINIITLYLEKRCVNSMEEVTGSTWFCEPRRTCVHLYWWGNPTCNGPIASCWKKLIDFAPTMRRSSSQLSSGLVSSLAVLSIH